MVLIKVKAMTKRLKVKLVKQLPGYCGPASLKMILDFYGTHKSLEELAKMIKTKEVSHPAGSMGENILLAAKKLGFDGFVKDWSQISDICDCVKGKGMPVIINWFSGYESHYSVVVKVDNENVYYFDPEYNILRKMKNDRLEKVWFGFEGGFCRQKPKLIVRRIIAIYPKNKF
ncbi:MAG: cysteine peptidase family C39 domain-containing protein [Candidatus Buchananbacteria bacterium]